MASAVLGFAAGFAALAHRSAFGVLYPAMISDLGWSVGEITAAFSLGMLVYLPAIVLSGLLLDRFGVRWPMLIGALLLFVGLAAVSAATELWHVYAAYGLAISLGNSATGFVAVLKMFTQISARRVGLALGIFNAGQGAGALVTSPLVQLIEDFAGWRMGFLAVGLSCLFVLAPLVVLGAPGWMKSSERDLAVQAARDKPIWRETSFWLIFAANGLTGYLLLLPIHQVAHFIARGLPELLAATAGGLLGGAIGLGGFLGGWWADRVGPKPLVRAGALMLTVGVLALLWSGPDYLWLLPIYVLAGGLGRGVLSVCVAVLQARTVAGPSFGRLSGLLDLGFGLGAVAGPYFVGVSRDFYGSYIPGLATAIPVGLAGAFCMLLVRPPGRRPG